MHTPSDVTGNALYTPRDTSKRSPNLSGNRSFLCRIIQPALVRRADIPALREMDRSIGFMSCGPNEKALLIP